MDIAKSDKLRLSHCDNKKFFKMINSLEPTSNPIVNSVGGFIYLYEADSASKLEDWRADGWHWRQQGGKYILFEGATCKKFCFYSVVKNKQTGEVTISNEFKRECFTHPDFPMRILIHYIGDYTVQGELCHGNSRTTKKKVSNFLMTQQSQRQVMKNSKGLPGNIYKNLVCAAPSEKNLHIVTAPRDNKQVQNFQAADRKRLRLTRDALYNLQELALETKFIKYMVTYPDLTCIMYLDSLWEKIKGLLNRSDIPHLCFTYDTTFNLGDVFVSVLIVRYEEFSEGPVVPLMFMMHERKTKETHHLFFRKLVQYFPELTTASNIYIVTDEETAFVSAIKEYLPLIDTFRCWIHIMKNAKIKLKNISITSKEKVSSYMNDLRSLFRQESEFEYYKKVSEIFSDGDRWDKDFVAYYKQHIHSQMDRTGRWALAPHNIESANTNTSESYNWVLKRFQDIKEVPIDTLSLGMQRLSEFHDVEILRGRYKIGTLTIRPELASLYDKEKDNPVFSKTVAPNVIVETIMAGLSEIVKKKVDATTIGTEKQSDYFEDNNTTTYALAARVITDKNIQFNIESGEFIVNGDPQRSISRVVKLKPATFSSVICSCPATAICYHIVAAQMVLNCYDSSTKRPRNSTLMRKRAKKAADKRSGSKKPRLLDEDRPTIPQSKKNNASVMNSSAIGLSTGCKISPIKKIEPPMDSIIAEPNKILLNPTSDFLTTLFGDSSQLPLIGQEKNFEPANGVLDEKTKKALLQPHSLNQETNQKNSAKVDLSVTLKSCDDLDILSSTTRDCSTIDSKLIDLLRNADDDNADIVIKTEVQAPYAPTQTRAARKECLTQEEILEVSEKNSWLHDYHVNAAMGLIKDAFPSIGGLYDCTLGAILEYPMAIGDSWIQLIHDGSSHWVVAIKNKENSFVSIYDSLSNSSTESTRQHVLGCVSALLRTQEKSFQYITQRCQQQVNGSDCGFLAIAFAISFANGDDPSSTAYDLSMLRTHLRHCFSTGKLTIFPQEKETSNVIYSMKSSLKKEKVYCNCRRIWYTPKTNKKRGRPSKIQTPNTVCQWNLILCQTCSEWFHKQCENWPKDDKTRGIKWQCTLCLKKLSAKKPK